MGLGLQVLRNFKALWLQWGLEFFGFQGCGLVERRVRVLGFILFLAMFVHAPASSVLRVWGVDFLRDSGCRPWRVLGFEPFLCD